MVAGAFYSQGTSGAPAADNPAYQFLVFVDSPNQGVVDGSLKLPGGTVQPLTPSLPDPPELAVGFASAAALSAAYPAGNYELTLNTVHNGPQKFPLALPSGDYPAAPVFLEPAMFAAVNPAASLTVTWSPFAGGTHSDFVQFEVTTPGDDPVVQSPQPGLPGALDGTAVAFTIPAGALDAGTTYFARVLHGKAQLGSANGSSLVTGHFSRTRIPLKTTGPSSDPVLAIAQVGEFQFKLHATGVTGRNYLIQGTSSLAEPVQWLPLVNYQGSTAGFDFTDGVVHAQQYYRVLALN